MTYSVKHKASGRYGIINPNGEWLDDFLGTKEEAQAKAEELNASILSDDNATVPVPEVEVDQDHEDKTEEVKGVLVCKSEKKDQSSRARARFVLTKDGWVNQ